MYHRLLEALNVAIDNFQLRMTAAHLWLTPQPK